MYLDFAAAVILILCIIFGEKRGFVRSLTSAFGWLFSLFFAFLYSPALADYISENTPAKQLVYDFSMKHMKSLFPEAAGLSGNVPSDLPSSLANAIAGSASDQFEQLAQPVAEQLAETIISVISFFIVVFVVKFLIHFIERLAGRIRRVKIVGTVDGILGMLFGIVKGAVLIYLLMAVLIFAAATVSYKPLTETLQSSVVVNFLESHDLLFFGENVIGGIELPETDGASSVR